jgi:2-polyprenyl-3-methyl-5-hydroxy-6-metoxy-1,4-benzoquinol methylase
MDKQLRRYEGDYSAEIVTLSDLKVRIFKDLIVGIDETPHYQYALGNHQPYKDFLVKYNHLYDSSLESFEHIMNDDSCYLEGEHEADFIHIDGDNIIVDGVHRATRLFHLGAKEAPVVRIMALDHKNYRLPLSATEEERDSSIANYVNTHKDTFPEWYQPIRIGSTIIPTRTYPSFVANPASLQDNTCGQLKWHYILKDNLPDLTGKTVCDIGCSAGIFSIEMARAGAKHVDGFDRGPDVIQANNAHLGAQSVAQQAYLVRNMYECFYNKRINNVEFHEADLMTMDFSRLKYDVFFACCVLYHLGAEKMEQVIREISENIPEVFLQANDGHGGELGQLSSFANHVMLLEKYGYTIVNKVAPPGYVHPIVYARKDLS